MSQSDLEATLAGMGGGGANVEVGSPPIIRWAGGKRWILPKLRSLIGKRTFSGYHEPFLGGGAVYFGLRPGGRAFLSDLNTELIDTFVTVCEDPDAVSAELSEHENSAEYYYSLRQRTPKDAAARAARFIFLNHTSFNGIYRVNLEGTYNVPYGNRSSLRMPTHEQLREASRALRSATLTSGDFGTCLATVEKNDLVFLDPPYTVAHNQNGFVKYNQRLFSFTDQERLSVLIDQVRERGAYYILTNAAHESIETLFEKGDLRLSTSRRNNVGGRMTDRGPASEYLFTNLRPE